MKSSLLSVLALVLIVGCSPDNEDSDSSSSTPGTNTQTPPAPAAPDQDSGSDSDTDSGTDTDAAPDTDTGTDPGTDTTVDNDTGSDTDTGTTPPPPAAPTPSPVAFGDFSFTASTEGLLDFELLFTGDTNEDASVSVFYCNSSDTPSCAPTVLLGDMARNSDRFELKAQSFTPPNDGGDTLEFKIVGSDVDGVTGTSEHLESYTLPVLATALSSPFVEGIVDQGFNISVPVTGDDNSNRSLSLLYCNNSDSPGCMPVLDLKALINTPSSSYAIIDAADLAGANDPGDELTVRVQGTDADGLSGLPADINITLATSTVTHIFRSVGPGNTTALAAGSANELVISNNLATFETPLPDNVGVGDGLQYDSDNDGSIDAIAFIHLRISPTEYIIKDQAGAPPLQTTSDNDWSLFRAYTSLKDAESGAENMAFDNAVRTFEPWSSGQNLITSDKIWNIALYGDGIDPGGATVLSWTTSQENYLRIFAPSAATQVGVSQRHSGVWDVTKATAENTNNTIIYALNDYTIIDGIQFDFTVDGTNGSKRGLRFNGKAGSATENIIRTNFTSTGKHNSALTGFSSSTTGKFNFVNNIIYGVNTSPDCYGIETSGSGAFAVYNNTVSGFDTTFLTTSNSTLINNIAQNSNTKGFRNAGTAQSDYNISDHADAPGTNSHNSIMLSFVSPSTGDYHLNASDIEAVEGGLNLFTDSFFPFTIDAARTTRSGTWDIGALAY